MIDRDSMIGPLLQTASSLKMIQGLVYVQCWFNIIFVLSLKQMNYLSALPRTHCMAAFISCFKPICLNTNFKQAPLVLSGRIS